MNFKNNCMICNKELIYLKEPKNYNCVICGKEFCVDAVCEDGHYVCDHCHSKEGVAIIKEICSHSTSKNPIELMDKIMREPSVHIHGPEHHVLVGASLLTAYKNCGGEINLNEALLEMVRRGKQVPGGVCGFWGCCGAAVSSGIAVSIITGSTPLKNEEWRLSNLMTSNALKAIGEIGGPRCCKRDSFTAVKEAAKFMENNLKVKIEIPEEISCNFSNLNQQCIGNRCPYHIGSMEN